MPEHPKTTWSVVEDVLLGPSVLACRLVRVCVPTREYRVLTSDGAVKIALALKVYKRNIFRTSAAKAHTECSRCSRHLDSSSALCP